MKINTREIKMARVSEILFVDPTIFDLDTVLSGLRPGVETIVLDPSVPAAQQIATALANRRGLDAVHIIAHGSSGRVNLASGGWSIETLEHDAEELAVIGRALAVDGELRLWSCDAASGPVGTAFIETLAQATGAGVAAATGRIGAATLGGTWDLTARSHPTARAPLTAAAMAAYAGVLATKTWSYGGINNLWSNGGNWSPSGVPGS